MKSKIKSFIKIILIILLIFFAFRIIIELGILLSHYVMNAIGLILDLVKYHRANTLTTLLFYLIFFGLLYLVIWLFETIFLKQRKLTNLKLTLLVFISSLFVGELFLKYVIQSHLNYTEKNGFGYYCSLYKEDIVLNTEAKKHQFEDGAWLRIHIPDTEWLEEKTEFSFLHKYNSLGYRDNEFIEPTDSTYLILGLGDSFTEGSGTHQDSTWLKFLERKLYTNSSSIPVKTWNIGTSGNDPVYEYKTLEKFARKFAIDLVILAINTSDLDEIMIRGGIERFQADKTIKFREPPWWEPLYAISFIFRSIIHDVYHYNELLLMQDTFNKQTEESLNIIRDCVLKMKELAVIHHFDLLIVSHPTGFETSFDSFIYDRVTGKLKEKNDLDVIDLMDLCFTSGIMNRQNVSDFYWKLDGHNNSKGYQLWGELLADHIMENNLISGKDSLIKDMSTKNN